MSRKKANNPWARKEVWCRELTLEEFDSRPGKKLVLFREPDILTCYVSKLIKEDNFSEWSPLIEKVAFKTLFELHEEGVDVSVSRSQGHIKRLSRYLLDSNPECQVTLVEIWEKT